MSEYWVSKKKYFCKYCEIYIADDAPSRQQHENGLRHKGNVERFIRGIYKAGEKQKKDREEEKREMKRVEQAAAAAFAQDIGAGIAKPAGSAASSSGSTTAQKPLPKPSNPYSNYSTAASLGYTDPDADRLAEEMRIRQTQGVAGDWVMTSTVQQSAPVSLSNIGEQWDTIATSDTTGGADVGVKREAEGHAEDDVRAFKLRKKQLPAGLGEMYDPGFIPIKIKKKEEPQNTPPPGSSLTTESEPEPSTMGPLTSKPKWTTIQLAKRPNQDSNNSGAATTKVEEDIQLSRTTTSNPSSKWAKAKWSEPTPDIPPDRTSMFGLQEPDERTLDGEQTDVKTEEPNVKAEGDANIPSNAVENGGENTGGIKFRKRRAPINAARGRREI